MMAVARQLPVLLFIFAATVVQFPRAERSTLDLEEPTDAEADLLEGEALLEQISGSAPNTRFTECDKLKRVINCKEFEPEYLGVGSFGQAWLVEDLNGRKVALKLLHFPEDNSKYVYIRDLKDAKMEKKIHEAKKECAASQELARGSDNPSYRGHGEQRIMQCFGHNFDTTDKSQPLYMLLEYAGGESLRMFQNGNMDRQTWSLSMVGKLAKQLLEGIDYLQSFRRPWIHHDLKPANLVVRTHQGPPNSEPSYTLKLIDLGATIHVGEGDKPFCGWLASSEDFAPPESKYRRSGDPACPMITYDPKHPEAYDAYAFGSVLVDMLTGNKPFEVADMMRKRAKITEEKLALLNLTGYTYAWNRERGEIRAVFERPNAALEIVKKISEFKKVKGNPPFLCNEVLKNPVALRFMTQAFKTLHARPEERPTVAQLLKEPWMQELAVPDEPDYAKDQRPGATADVHSTGDNELEEPMDTEGTPTSADTKPQDNSWLGSWVRQPFQNFWAGGTEDVPSNDAKPQESWLGSLVRRPFRSFVRGGRQQPQETNFAAPAAVGQKRRRLDEDADPSAPLAAKNKRQRGPEESPVRAAGRQDAAAQKWQWADGGNNKDVASAHPQDVEMQGFDFAGVSGRRPIKKARRRLQNN